jgi:hypothetical protein
MTCGRNAALHCMPPPPLRLLCQGAWKDTPHAANFPQLALLVHVMTGMPHAAAYDQLTSAVHLYCLSESDYLSDTA